MQNRRLLPLTFLLVLGCEAVPARQAARLPAAPSGDTITTAMRDALDRFRATVQGPPPQTLMGGAASRDELVHRFTDAVARADTAALIHMTMNRGEFAHLYYPHTIYTRPPYELDAEHAWLLNRAHTEKGLTRILRRFGGQPLGGTAYACETEPRQEGPNRYWDGCRVTRAVAGVPHSMRWFGSIWERDGRFKFVGYVTDL
jgi:hypothetical protein